MFTFLSYVLTLVVGVVAGALVYRNNLKKAEAALAKAEALLKK